MKPIHLNLASRPYRDYRPVYAVVVAVSLLTAFLMLNNIETYYRYTHETQATRAKIADLEKQTQRERDLDQAAQARLRTLDLAMLDNQTRFINARLAERAFSWSSLLDQLEAVLADDVRLLSVAPSFNEDGTIALSLSFESKLKLGMLATIDAMNRDPQFVKPFPSGESVAAGIYSFNLTAGYRPPRPVALRTAAKPAASKGGAR